MILDLILTPLTNALVIAINLLPDITFASVPLVNFIAWMTNIMNLVTYVVPVAPLMTMFTLYILIKNFEFGWAVIKRIYDLIPFV